MRRLLVLSMMLVMLAGCESESGTRVDAAAVTRAPVPWPRAIVPASADAPPRILALWLSATQVDPGRDWYGKIATTTNVASVEVRTESFSFNAQRIGYGQFVFDQHVLDIVPQYKRGYLLEVIARNAAGAQTARLVPIGLH